MSLLFSQKPLPEDDCDTMVAKTLFRRMKETPGVELTSHDIRNDLQKWYKATMNGQCISYAVKRLQKFCSDNPHYAVSVVTLPRTQDVKLRRFYMYPTTHQEPDVYQHAPPCFAPTKLHFSQLDANRVVEMLCDAFPMVFDGEEHLNLKHRGVSGTVLCLPIASTLEGFIHIMGFTFEAWVNTTYRSVMQQCIFEFIQYAKTLEYEG